LPGIELKEINDMAAKMPETENAFALITAPAKMKDQLPSSEELQKEIIAATRQEVTPYEEKAIAKSLMEQAPVPGKVTSETQNAKLGTTDMTLSNGVTITIKPTTFKNDQILMDGWRKGGYQRFPLADKENVQYAAQIVQMMGVKDMSPTDLDKFLSGKSVSVTPYINDYEEGIEGGSSVKDFETFLQLTHLFLTQPRKDQSLFNSFISKQKSSIQFLRQNPQYFFQDTLMKIVYNNNPWVSVLPTIEGMNSLNADKALTYYKQIFDNADGLHFTFVGNIDPKTARPLLEKYLGSLPGKPEEHMFKDNGIRPVQGVVNANIKKGKEAQSVVTVLWTGETQYSREENIALKALLDVLNIKVIEKLREEMSGMYSGGLGGSIQKRPYVHYTISASIPCGPENVDKLTAALFDLIKNAQEKGIDPKDLEKVKETWKKQYRVSLQENESWLTNLSQAFIDNNSPENILDFEQKVNALTVQDLQKVAKKFLRNDNYIKAVLYPENAQVSDSGKKTF
jgi:zinc protease